MSDYHAVARLDNGLQLTVAYKNNNQINMYLLCVFSGVKMPLFIKNDHNLNQVKIIFNSTTTPRLVFSAANYKEELICQNFNSRTRIGISEEPKLLLDFEEDALAQALNKYINHLKIQRKTGLPLKGTKPKTFEVKKTENNFWENF